MSCILLEDLNGLVFLGRFVVSYDIFIALGCRIIGFVALGFI